MSRWGVASAVVLVGLLAGGQGFLNGDAAAYAAQGWQGDAASRPIHLVWTVLAVVLAPLAGEALPRVLDGLVAVAAGGMVVGTRGERALVAAGVVLPWCAFAEVDLPWMCLVLVASSLRSTLGASVLTALAVGLSPTALLALPWLARWRCSPAPLLAGGAAVLALTLLSQGGWWTGPRGVLHSELLLGRSLGAWGLSAAWLAVLGGDRRILWLAPLVLAPPDVPAWVLVGVVAASGLPASRWLPVLAVGAVLAGGWGLVGRWGRVGEEQRQLEAIAAAHRPGEGYEGPWSWCARLGVVVDRRVDGVPFRPVRPLLDGSWPSPEVDVVGLLPPGREPSAGQAVLRVDERGVRWVAPWW